MTLELRSEQPEVQRPCFEPVITEPRAKVSLRRPNGHERRHGVRELIAANPPVPANEIFDYQSLVATLRARADSLEVSRGTIDSVAGLADGHASKILALSRLRRIGMESLGPMLDALCLKLVAMPCDEAFARNRSLLVKRDDAHFRSARQGHDGKPGKRKIGKKSAFAKISGSITARLFGWPAS